MDRTSGKMEKAVLAVDNSSVLVYHRSQARELLGLNSVKQASLAEERSLALHMYVHDLTEKLLPRKWKSRSSRIAQAILDTARAKQMDPLFLMSVIRQESVFDPDVVGSHGEIGLMQIKPSTAQWLVDEGVVPRPGNKDMAIALRNPAFNVAVGSAYLAQLRTRFKRGALFINAYNMGVGNVNSLLRDGQRPRRYSDKILAHYSQYAEKFRSYSTGEGLENRRRFIAYLPTNFGRSLVQ